MKIALVQMPSAKGEIKINSERMSDYISFAAKAKADVAVFPEMSLTGYFTENNYIDTCLELESKPVKKVVGASKDIAILFGIGEKDNSGYHITQIFAQNGKIVGVYRKHNVQSGEEKIFSSGVESPIFDLGGVRFGITICADIDLPELYKEYATKGCKVVFECASPDLYGDRENRNWEKGYLWWKNNCITKIGNYARENKINIAVATQSGRNMDDDFPGGGYLFSTEGKIIAETKDYQQEVLFCRLP
ncbi:MAG: carbon-nitrogen hydrolase family protein [Patescibacteria group bacterium]|jgi:predicted amidohydrolase